MEIDPTVSMIRLERAIQKAKKAWDKLYDAESVLMRAAKDCTEEERKALMNGMTARDFFGGLGA